MTLPTGVLLDLEGEPTYLEGFAFTSIIEGVDYVLLSEPVTHSPALIAARLPALKASWDCPERKAAAAERMKQLRASGAVKNIYTEELCRIRSDRMKEVWRKRREAREQ